MAAPFVPLSITKEGAFGADIRNAINSNFSAIAALFPAAAPSTASSTGTAGQITFDATHIYVCVATNTWVRATLATW